MPSRCFRAVFFALIVAVCARLAAEDLLATDIQLGLQRHRQILERWRLLDRGEEAERVGRVGMQVAFGGMWKAPVPPLLYIVDDPEVNAFATGGGRVYVTGGLLAALEGSEGMLAFVLAHEMAHNTLQHGAQRLLREFLFQQQYAELQSNCRNGDQPACIAAGALGIAFRIAERKRERDEEHEADRLGMMAAAEAGYHPNFAVLVARRLREVTREQSKFAAFFSTHPRWTTREERALRLLTEARKVFERKWLDARLSPGGMPPPLAVMSKPEVKKEKDQIFIYTVLSIFDLGDLPAGVRLQLVGERPLPEPFTAERSWDSSRASPQEVYFQIPREFFKQVKGKVWARLLVFSEGNVLLQSGDLRVR